ncbi:MAG: hypothetical protein MI924_22250 [Chloroflexales bacterium]|nr:hypothetical protein [Chloroflexales bacterium]
MRLARLPMRPREERKRLIGGRASSLRADCNLLGRLSALRSLVAHKIRIFYVDEHIPGHGGPLEPEVELTVSLRVVAAVRIGVHVLLEI